MVVEDMKLYTLVKTNHIYRNSSKCKKYSLPQQHVFHGFCIRIHIHIYLCTEHTPVKATNIVLLYYFLVCMCDTHNINILFIYNKQHTK